MNCVHCREEFQGVKAPVSRSEEDFDPGSKYHVPSNVPYSRYVCWGLCASTRYLVFLR